MKKGPAVGIIVVIVLVVAGGAYELMHNSNSQPVADATTKSSSTAKPTINNAIVITKTDATVGQYLATPAGLPLYTYASDTSGVSNCTGECLSEWPAYQNTGATTSLPLGFSTITRTDNSHAQFTYNGMPLYTFVDDKGGMATGNGKDGFNIAKPTAAPTSAASSQPAGTSNSSSGYSSSSNW